MARMRSFTGMPHNVIHKMFFSRKTFLTNITTMRSFPRVLSYVIYHVFFTRERFITILTPLKNKNLKKIN